MKIRQGFVSNSSSSSFCILGINITSKQYDRLSSVPYDKRTPTTLDVESGISDEDVYYAGYGPEKMRENETLSQFKDRIVEELKNSGFTVDKSKLTWITDGGYDG